MKQPLMLLLSSMLLVARVATVQAAWILDGIPLTGTRGDAFTSSCVSDGAGGAIILWTDNRNGSYDVFAQRVNGFGVPQWTANGVAICTAINDQGSAVAIPDGAGGAIIVWTDGRNPSYDIFAQRVNGFGVPQWTADGVALCTASDTQIIPSISSDEAGGAVVAWQDGRSGTNWDIYARRINSAGTPQWTANGEPICLLASGQTGPHAVSDGTGGVIVVFDDARSGPNVYAQRMNSLGAPRWTVNGVPVCAATGDQGANRAISDGAGGAIIAWEDERLTTPPRDIFAQRINSLGAPVWPVDGVELCIATDDQSNLSLATDGANGAIVAWQDNRSGFVDIYAQRVNSLGAVEWTYNGQAVCTASSNQQPPIVVADGSGGGIVSWQDPRNGNDDIFAQKVNTTGVPLWQVDGAPLCTASGGQSGPFGVADGAGGMIVAWTDYRTGTWSRVFAQRAEQRYGYWGRPEPTIVSAEDNPNDQGGKVIVRWAASGRDQFDLPGVSEYSLWRSTDVVALEAAASSGARIVTDPAAIPADFAGGAILETTGANGPEYWEWIATLTATYQPTYSYTAPTRQDSVAAGPAPHSFKVLAHEYTFPLGRAWESAAVSAYSVDNLAPAAPIQLSGSRAPIGDVVLAWKSGGEIPDLDHYNVYRSGATGVTPTPPFLLDASDSPSFDDLTAPSGPVHYLVTAVDIHGNESLPSNIVALFDATGTGGNSPPIKALTVLQNRPNPFAGSTDLQIGLPAASDVHVEVYDIAGRKVSTVDVKGAAAGWRSVPFAGLDGKGKPLASGVYFYKVTAHGTTVTNKMVIAR